MTEPASTTRKDGSRTRSARGYSRPPFAPGNDAAVRHGADSARRLRPIVDELLAELPNVAPWAIQPAFVAAAEAWAWAEARCRVYRQHFDAVGLVADDGGPVPGQDRWDRSESRAETLRARLGLDLAAMVKLIGGLAQVPGTPGEDAIEALKATGRAIREAAERRGLEVGETAEQPHDDTADDRRQGTQADLRAESQGGGA